MLPEKIRSLAVSIGALESAGQLLKTSTYEFRYLDPNPEQSAVALLMSPRENLTWQDGDLFPVMDQNMPEGDLFMRIRSLFPKQPMTPMHLLALVGLNGIGRLGYILLFRFWLWVLRFRLQTQPKSSLCEPSRASLKVSASDLR